MFQTTASSWKANLPTLWNAIFYVWLHCLRRRYVNTGRSPCRLRAASTAKRPSLRAGGKSRRPFTRLPLSATFERSMRVLYDYQAFGAQRAGGVSRYFVELLREWRRGGAVSPELVAPLSVNCDLAEARAELGSLGDSLQMPAAWRPGPALALANRALFAAAIFGRDWDLYHPTYY